MEDGKSESVRGSRAQAGINGTLVFFKAEPSWQLNPQRCLPGLIWPRPLVPSHLSELHSTPPHPSVSHSLWSLCSFLLSCLPVSAQHLHLHIFTIIALYARQKREASRLFSSPGCQILTQGMLMGRLSRSDMDVKGPLVQLRCEWHMTKRRYVTTWNAWELVHSFIHFLSQYCWRFL